MDVNGVLFNKETGTLVTYPAGKTGTNYTLPFSIGGKTVTSIGIWAFERCASLTSVTIPDTVTSIAGGAFENCDNLTSITFLGNAPSIVVVDSFWGLEGWEFDNPFLGMSDEAKIYIQSNATGFGEIFEGLPVSVLSGNEVWEPDLNVTATRLPSGAIAQILVNFSTSSGKSYTIEQSADMKGWQVRESGIAGNGGIVERNFPATDDGGKWFLRVSEE